MAASIYIIPTLGPKVCRYDLLWAIWSPNKSKNHTCGAGGCGQPSLCKLSCLTAQQPPSLYELRSMLLVSQKDMDSI